ncbi:MAG: GWxTD domain-containing protein [Chloroherpetonaceae bacterium]|nr:GWxTD domain-containing protein [Chloroherpetonaceae bacterium]
MNFSFFSLTPILKVVFTSCFLLFSGACLAQQMGGIRAASEPPLEFDYDVYSFSGDRGESMLSIYTRIPFTKLSFIKNEDLFFARFETNVTILDENERIVMERQKIDTIKTPFYEQTQSNQLTQPNLFSFISAVGDFDLLIQIRDIESGRNYKNRRKISVKNFNASYPIISSLMPALLLTDSSSRVRLIPSLNTLMQKGREPLQFYYEIYSPKKQSLNLSYTFFQKGRVPKEYKKFTRLVEIDRGRNKCLDTLFSTDFESGDYELILFTASGENEIQDASKLSFTVRLVGVSYAIKDLTKAIDQLRYIASGSDLDSLRDAPNNDVRVKRFNEFWKRFDPTPDTPENELMNEYYARIEFANQKFSNQGEGWRTDMGFIFVKYGQPDFVERQPQTMNNLNTEIWEYYQHRRRFIFVDRTGFNDYRLLFPEPDSRTYIR